MKTFRLTSRTARQLAASFCLEAPDGMVVSFKEPSRSLEQNALMWARLSEIAKHVEWSDWQGNKIRMEPEEWKDFLWATFKKDQRMVMGEDGRSFVLVREDSGTSKAGVKEMGLFLDFMEAFGTQRGVRWSAPIAMAEARR